MHARVVLGLGKGVLFREVSSVCGEVLLYYMACDKCVYLTSFSCKRQQLAPCRPSGVCGVVCE